MELALSELTKSMEAKNQSIINRCKEELLESGQLPEGVVNQAPAQGATSGS